MSHPSEELLNDYVDGLLPDGERLEVRRHLDSCPDCGRTVAELEDLIARAGALGEVAPSRDLLPGIRPAEAPATPAKAGWLRWAAAAAVIGLVGLLAVLRFGAGGAGERSIETLLADFRAAETEYIRATEMLAAALEERRDEIAPETLAVIDRSLAEIDVAIRQARQARDRDDDGVENNQLLTALYNKKLNVLMSASRLSS